MSERTRLVLFPGLGMDGRTFEPQRAGIAGAEVVVPGWVRPGWGETLGEYSKRMAGEVARGLDGWEGKVYLGGVSIGGAIALEVARTVPAAGVFLIASATTSEALPNLLRIVGRGAPWVPKGVLGPVVRRVAPRIVRWIMRGYPEARRLLPGAVRELDLDIWRWGARAIMTWELGGVVACPVHQIHGDADVITPVYRVRPDVVVQGGGHMLNLTHPGEVNAFIEGRMGTGNSVASGGVREG